MVTLELTIHYQQRVITKVDNSDQGNKRKLNRNGHNTMRKKCFMAYVPIEGQ